jgi:hypothetical protein
MDSPWHIGIQETRSCYPRLSALPTGSLRISRLMVCRTGICVIREFRLLSGSRADIYRDAALRILRTLATEYRSEDSGVSSLLTHSVGGKPQNTEVDVGLIYADYYFIEAILRSKGMFLE